MSRYDPSSYSRAEKILPWERSQKNLDESFPIVPTADWFKNDFGSIRWWKIRSAYFDDIIDTDFVEGLYLEWRDTDEYFMLNGIDASDHVVASVFVKASKRGNDVYISQLNSKFCFLDSLPNIEFFMDWGVQQTPMLFITLTVDTKQFSLNQSWFSISKSLNRFETLLRQKYGKFVKFRVWESHESGYPHCHIVIYFHDKWFQVFDHFTKDGKLTYRIADKHRQAIREMWNMGNVDIQGVQDTLGALSEVKKYITKNIWSNKGNKTNAMLTLFHKQSYSISQCNPFINLPKIEGSLTREKLVALQDLELKHFKKCCYKDFIGAIWGLDVYLEVYRQFAEGLAEPSLNALVNATMCNYNNVFPEIVKWEFVGFILGEDLARFLDDFGGEFALAMIDPSPDLFCYVNFAEVS
jgi:hypothetical protein